MLAVILLLGLALRLVLVARAPTFLIPVDSGEFFAAGYALVERGEFALPLKRAPGYPLFLATSISLVGPNPEAIALIQHLLGLISVVLVYCLGALVFGRPAGLLAALGVALNGGLLLIEHSLMSEAFFAPLVLGALLLLLLAIRTGRLPLFLAGGLMLGLTALTRSAGQAILPLALGAVVLALPDWRRRLAATGLVVLGFGLLVGPWLLRNRATHGITAISSGLGDALFARTHRHDQGFEFRDRSKMKLEREEAHIRNRVFELAREYRFSREVRERLQAEFGISHERADRALRDASLQVIRQEPQRYLFGTVGMYLWLLPSFEKELDEFWDTRTRPKFLREWPDDLAWVLGSSERWSEADHTLVDSLSNLYEDHHLGLLFWPLVVLGTLRGLVGWRGGHWLLPAVMASQLLLYVALDGPLFRYRAQLQPLITLLVCGGAAWLAAWLWSRARQLTPARGRPRLASAGASGAPAPDVG